MFEGFEPFTVSTQTSPEVTIYGIKSGNPVSLLPPLLMIHGCPQSHHVWHRIAEQVTDRYTVIAIDIRGYGKSSKPGDIASYAKSAMARDCVAVMDHLGYTNTPFFVCAHDRGARVAHKLCVDFPDRIRKAIFLDICPTLAMYKSTNFNFAKAYFHWFFLIQQEPIPETLINAAPRQFAELFLGGHQSKGIFDKDNFEYYVSLIEQPAVVHAMCNDYRASATLDLEEAEADLEAGRFIQSPLMVLWGKYGVIENGFDAITEWQKVTNKNVSVKGKSVESGHYIPEQAPADVVRAMAEFFV
ncbi:alpha/beta hydrolase fold protein [Colletotrichum tofieldiae]|uniref:Alpha/beta hydrolase fold protein n=1 Tax=Colletotrichum tofieldiae TaxID=708197 RepID=A0A166ZAI8_9PEZI|nr:alpha/beta hydrolase fold protein [Colletotrichum tofieldiae]GKT55866.1 alpha/beta hydrolase fold protein [Colletotrichum tofieldiae]GKT79296.1 alpha/beta hydrolase fold protein [Colletotrichum tofieldiae]GKT82465.1 alpha/beta hydrolase fold protein [Colletotrichum tofieldiae]